MEKNIMNECNEMLSNVAACELKHLSKAVVKGDIKSFSISLRSTALEIHIVLDEVGNKYVSDVFYVYVYSDDTTMKVNERLGNMVQAIGDYLKSAPYLVEKAKRECNDKDMKIELLTKELENLYVKAAKLETENNNLKQQAS